MIYLASPYSHPDPLIREMRFSLVEKFMNDLMNDGIYIMSPIVLMHNAAKTYVMPKDAAFWKKYNTELMDDFQKIYVLCIDGWEESKGVQDEIKYARMNKMQITYVIPQLHAESSYRLEVEDAGN